MDGELESLRYHWGSAYTIMHPRPDVWVAQRRDTLETLRAATAERLRDEIQRDYLARPVPRE